MLILLPPSEAKRPAGGRGRPVQIADLAFAELYAVRAEVLAGLAELSRGPDALARLGLPTGRSADLNAHRDLLTAPARPAIEVYTGVLFQALDWATLTSSARRRAASSVLLQSALWGPIRPRDRITPYRLAMGTRLPSGQTVAATWRAALTTLPAPSRGPIVDCRSSTYAAVWRPSTARSDQTVQIRVFRQSRGQRTVVSHLAKHTRGLVARWLLQATTVPRSIEDVADVVGAHASCELGPGVLDVIEPAPGERA